MKQSEKIIKHCQNEILRALDDIDNVKSSGLTGSLIVKGLRGEIIGLQNAIDFIETKIVKSNHPQKKEGL